MKKYFVISILTIIIFVFSSCSAQENFSNQNSNSEKLLPIDESKIYTVSFIIRIPENTPANSNIYMVCNANDWNSGDENYRFKKTEEENTYILKVLLPKNYHLEFLFSRGSEFTYESDMIGFDVNPRSYNFIFDGDIVTSEIENWKDLN